MSGDLMARIQKLGRRAMGMITRGVIEAVDDAPTLQTVQISGMEGELFDGVEHFQPYGFAAHPHADAEAILLSAGGTRSHGLVIIAADRRYRLRAMEAGEVAIYDDQDQVVRLKRDGIFLSSPFKIDIEAPEVTVTADVATIEADTVNLGGTGGPAVARVGDTVAGGVITSGSATVKAV